ncbi:hypothetical protein J6590_081091 [Homalodisca vitripennis]|nr:hypothetical protein J6590_081091 [Homalodisca vitripennis]
MEYSSLLHFKSVAALVALVLSNIDEKKRCKEPIPDIDEENLGDLIRNVDEETGNGNGITGNENTQGNCPTEQFPDTAACSVFMGDSDEISAKVTDKTGVRDSTLHTSQHRVVVSPVSSYNSRSYKLVVRISAKVTDKTGVRDSTLHTSQHRVVVSPVPSANLDKKASLSVSVEDDSNQFGGFHTYNLNSGMSELVPAYDTLDELQAQPLRAPEVELQDKEDDDIIDDSRYVLPYSHGPARRRHNRVNVIRAITWLSQYRHFCYLTMPQNIAEQQNVARFVNKPGNRLLEQCMIDGPVLDWLSPTHHTLLPSLIRCRETVSSFSVTAPLSLFQRGLGGDRAVGGESNLAPHPANDDPPLQQDEQSTAQSDEGKATRDIRSVYSHKGRVRAYGVRRLLITTYYDGIKN